jgi:hypothetical protein
MISEMLRREDAARLAFADFAPEAAAEGGAPAWPYALGRPLLAALVAIIACLGLYAFT